MVPGEELGIGEPVFDDGEQRQLRLRRRRQRQPVAQRALRVVREVERDEDLLGRERRVHRLRILAANAPAGLRGEGRAVASLRPHEDHFLCRVRGSCSGFVRGHSGLRCGGRGAAGCAVRTGRIPSRRSASAHPRRRERRGLLVARRPRADLPVARRRSAAARCDQIYRSISRRQRHRARPTLVSTGKGRTTCSLLHPRRPAHPLLVDRAARARLPAAARPLARLRLGGLRRATRSAAPRPDGSDLRPLTDNHAYDAEATVCPKDGSHRSSPRPATATSSSTAWTPTARTSSG